VKIRIGVIVRGQVQGVGFRHYTAKTASRHQVTGWVMNLTDGSVEACFEGEQEAVKAMVEWCRSGPDLARVNEVVETPGDYTGEFSEFSIRHAHE
jgi:acylphosphatase